MKALKKRLLVLFVVFILCRTIQIIIHFQVLFRIFMNHCHIKYYTFKKTKNKTNQQKTHFSNENT